MVKLALLEIMGPVVFHLSGFRHPEVVHHKKDLMSEDPFQDN